MNGATRKCTRRLKGISARVAAGDGTVGKLLRDDDLYVKVSDTVTSLESASSHARDLTASLSTFSAKLNRPGSLPDSLVTDRTSYASLTSTVGDLHRAGESVAGAMDGLATSVRDPTTPVGTLLHDQEAAAQLKATLENLNRGSALLADDLEAAQHNFLLRGFFKKREKAERHPPPSTGAEPANPQQ